MGNNNTMLGEENTKRFAPFKESAYIAFYISKLIPFLVLGFILVIAGFIVSVIYASIIVIVLLVLVIIGLLWYSGEFFRSFIYELRSDYLFSRKGVITPSYTIIPYKNVQDVHVEQSIYDRIFGLWAVKIYSATASRRGSDIIFGLSRNNAERLKSQILGRAGEVKQVVD